MAWNQLAVLDASRLAELAEAYRARYHTAQPFPHVVFDDFLSPELLDRVLAEFPGPGEQSWFRRETDWEKKLSLQDEQRMPELIRYVLYSLNSATFVSFLESLTGIDGLIPDPYFEGGGLHNIVSGGQLGVHVDFNCYEKLRLDRRINVIIYLNRDWRDEWGGILELWNREMTHCVKRVAPLFNRCLIFSTTETSYHGHPEPLRAPPGVSRKSLALYYYTNGRPEEERAAAHYTVWRARPNASDRLKKVRDLLRLFEPPIVQTTRRRIRDQLRSQRARSS
jgi:Rps23 Pro-64 3,4-dihydroxylase Tpa1-like proline 4-hydroxylase